MLWKTVCATWVRVFPVGAAPGQTVYPPNPRRFSLVAHLPSVFLRKSYTTEKSLLAKPFAISVR